MVTLNLKEHTKTRLTKLGNLGSTFDSVVNEILDHVESCDKFWSDKN